MISKIQKLKNKKGFTLVELIVVIAIIAILTAVLIPVIGNYTATAAQTAAKQAAAEVKQAVSVAIADVAAEKGIVMSSSSVAKASGLVSATTLTVTNDTDANDVQSKLVASLAETPSGDTFTVTVANNAVTKTEYKTAGGITVTMDASGVTVS